MTCVWPDEAHVQCDGEEDGEDTTAAVESTSTSSASIPTTTTSTSSPDISTKSEIACENFPLRLSCGWRQRLSILGANNGRTLEDVCPHIFHDTSNTDCGTINALSIVQSKCEDSRSCIVWARNSVFGDPCYLTYKYLEVEYICEDA